MTKKSSKKLDIKYPYGILYIGEMNMRNKPQIPPRTFWEDDNWAHENYQTLLKDYPNKWVAILNKTVICANADLKLVKAFLAKKIKGKAVPLLHIEDASHVY